MIIDDGRKGSFPALFSSLSPKLAPRLFALMSRGSSSAGGPGFSCATQTRWCPRFAPTFRLEYRTCSGTNLGCHELGPKKNPLLGLPLSDEVS